jgi:hypothetical protein
MTEEAKSEVEQILKEAWPYVQQARKMNAFVVFPVDEHGVSFYKNGGPGRKAAVRGRVFNWTRTRPHPMKAAFHKAT